MKTFTISKPFDMRLVLVFAGVIGVAVATAPCSLAQTTPSQVPALQVPSEAETTAEVNNAASSAINNFNNTIATPQAPLDASQPSPQGDAMPSTASYQGQLNELASLQRQLEVLKAQSNVASTSLQIDQTLQSIKDSHSAASANAAPAVSPALGGQAAQFTGGIQGMPRDYVTMISGIPGALKAFISIDGAPVLAEAGTTLPSGAKVSYVTQSGVYTDGTNGTPVFIGMTEPVRQASQNGFQVGAGNQNAGFAGNQFNPANLTLPNLH